VAGAAGADTAKINGIKAIRNMLFFDIFKPPYKNVPSSLWIEHTTLNVLQDRNFELFYAKRAGKSRKLLDIKKDKFSRFYFVRGVRAYRAARIM
jgi:hypothetical protein